MDTPHFYLNVQDTAAHYIQLLLSGVKAEETRTRTAYRLMERYLEPGMTVGIVRKGMVVGCMVYRGARAYGSREEFRAAYPAHRVPEGSCYDWTDGKGKVGLELSDPVTLDEPYPAPSSRWRGFRIA